MVSICSVVEGPDEGGHIVPGGLVTSSILQIGLCALCTSHLQPSKYLKMWFEGMSGGPCLPPVYGAGGRSAYTGEG